MSASPLAFLRGATPLFYEMLVAEPGLAAGPEGAGIIQGDAHLENFGAYSPAVQDEQGWKKGRARFHLNDFDEATNGAWRWDVLRLATSLLLAGRELGQSGPVVLGLCQALIDSHALAACSDVALPAAPAPIARLIERVDTRSQKKLLDDRTDTVRGQRHFLRGDRYQNVSDEIVRAVPAALAQYAERTRATGGPRPEQLEVLDVAFRVAGTGSLGALRVAVLTRGKAGGDGNWLFDLKEQLGSCVDVLAPRAPSGSRADFVEAALRTCVEPPPRMLGTSRLGEHDVLVRRLTPQEDKLSLGQLAAPDLAPLAAYLGALLGSAHRRGRARAFAPWSEAERGGIVDRAVELAGIHEATYLELCRITRTRK